MRFERLFSLGLLVCTIGCGGSGGDTIAPTDGGGGLAAAPTEATDSGAGQAASETYWDLLDETVLKVSVDPPLASEVTLQVRRRYSTEVHAPLKSLHYRVATETAPDAEWVVLPEPAKEDLGDGMFDSIYKTALTLPQGAANIQFKVDQGLGEPYELKDWTVEVEEKDQ